MKKALTLTALFLFIGMSLYFGTPFAHAQAQIGAYCNTDDPVPCVSGSTCQDQGGAYICVATNPVTNNPTSSGGINTTYIAGYSNSLKSIINDYLVPVLIAVAFIVFLYGVYKYFIAGAAKPEERKKGTTFVLYGIIGLVIIFSVWGLVAILSDTIGVQPGGGPPASGYPTL